MKRILAAGVVSLGLLAPSRTAAQQMGTMSADDIAREEHRLDFKVGQWKVEAKIKVSPTDYITGAGTLDIQWDDTRALVARMDISFDDFDVKGTTTRHFNPAKGQWDVGWFSDDGQGTVPQIDGRFQDGRFIEINYGVDLRGPFVGRLIIYDMSHDHFSVRKDQLYDDGTVYKDVWVYEATRVGG